MYGKADFLVNTLAYLGKIPGLQKIKENLKSFLREENYLTSLDTVLCDMSFTFSKTQLFNTLI